MRSREKGTLNRLAILAGIVGLTLAVAVPLALGTDDQRGPVTNYRVYGGARGVRANPRLSPVVIGAITTQGGQVQIGQGWTNGSRTADQYVKRLLGAAPGHTTCDSNRSTT